MCRLGQIREQIRQASLGVEVATITQLLTGMKVNEKQRRVIVEQAASWVKAIRSDSSPGLMESFLAEYGLSTREGVALMCLAEAYLRVPDEETLNELIQDKITPQDFARHLGHSSSLMVNASTWGLMLTGNILPESDHGGIASANRAVIHGAKVLLVEAGHVGGTCVNVGCVPKKVMWFGAHIAEAIHLYAKDYGFDVTVNKLDWQLLVNNREAYIERIHGAYERGFVDNGVSLIQKKWQWWGRVILQ